MTYLLLRACFSHFDLCMLYIYVVPLLYTHHYFGGVDTLLTCMLGNSGIQPMCIVHSLLLCYIWVRRPNLWESRTLCIYCACFFVVHIYDVVGYFLYGVEDGADYTDTYTYYWWTGLAGSQHWRTYTYLMIVLFFSVSSLYSD